MTKGSLAEKSALFLKKNFDEPVIMRETGLEPGTSTYERGYTLQLLAIIDATRTLML